jgi:hypothetical protein
VVFCRNLYLALRFLVVAVEKCGGTLSLCAIQRTKEGREKPKEHLIVLSRLLHEYSKK